MVKPHLPLSPFKRTVHLIRCVLYRIGEKFIEWTDETPSLDHILTNISLYYFTSGFPTSIYPYRQLETSRASSGNIPKPLGASWFPCEIFPMIEHVIRQDYNVVYFRKHDKGGHFAALECPREFWGDVEEWAGQVWKV
jgi:microsomal epoxide hydrolase